MRKWHFIIAATVAALLLGLSFAEIFPDPYYHAENVNFWVWLWREIDELLHGER